MWNWREFYQLVEQVRKYIRVLYSGESLVQIPQEESMGEPFLLHTISGIYHRNGKESTFCGYHAEQISASRLIWLYLKKIPDTDKVLFNVVFLRYGGKKPETQFRNQHGIRMVYRRMAESAIDFDIAGNPEQKGAEIFSLHDSFQKLVIIGRKETEIRKTTIAQLLDIFGRAADERGLLMLAEQNARILCQGNGSREDLHQNMG